MQAAGAGNPWKIGYGFLLSIVLVAVILLEVLAYLKASNTRSLPPTIQMDPNGVASIPTNGSKGIIIHTSFDLPLVFFRVLPRSAL